MQLQNKKSACKYADTAKTEHCCLITIFYILAVFQQYSNVFTLTSHA